MKCRNEISLGENSRWRWIRPLVSEPDAGVDHLLNFLHEAAGFAIDIKPGVPLNKTSPRRAVGPRNEEQALEELKEAFADIGCTVVRRGRLLTIVTAQEAKKHCVPLPRLAV